MNYTQQLIKQYFNEERGFGKYKPIALVLLKKTLDILEEYEIDYFFISGTLLGYIRHNDFIPWDDDIDLIVDSKILDHISEIRERYDSEGLQFLDMYGCKWMIKSCYKGRVLLDDDVLDWPEDCDWTWPFVDLFVYGFDDNREKITFFRKEWNADEFFPPQKVNFHEMTGNIPKNPDYFLSINYGPKYMEHLKSKNFSHKTEKWIDEPVINLDACLLK